MITKFDLKKFSKVFFLKQQVPEDILNRVIDLSSILKMVDYYKIPIKWNNIDEWYFFEIGERDYEIQEILSIFYLDKIDVKEKLILITFESYKYNKVFILDGITDFITFIEEYDKVVHENIEFMQPMDYILLLEADKKIILIHHDGYHTLIDLLPGLPEND